MYLVLLTVGTTGPHGRCPRLTDPLRHPCMFSVVVPDAEDVSEVMWSETLVAMTLSIQNERSFTGLLTK